MLEGRGSQTSQRDEGVRRDRGTRESDETEGRGSQTTRRDEGVCVCGGGGDIRRGCVGLKDEGVGDTERRGCERLRGEGVRDKKDEAVGHS